MTRSRVHETVSKPWDKVILVLHCICTSPDLIYSRIFWTMYSIYVFEGVCSVILFSFVTARHDHRSIVCENTTHQKIWQKLEFTTRFPYLSIDTRIRPFQPTLSFGIRTDMTGIAVAKMHRNQGQVFWLIHFCSAWYTLRLNSRLHSSLERFQVQSVGDERRFYKSWELQ